LRGAGSCAAAACHGGTGPASDLSCSYTTWTAKDKHVHAYEVLLTERSRTIERNYGQHSGAKLPRPEEDRLCLRCHSTDADAALAGKVVATSDGVSGERCHGPAEKWLALHAGRDWAALTMREKEALGFRPTKDLKQRAALCVECHVGTGDAQVDHDLYAAGHPRLNFELASYTATMPPHWDVRAEKARIPDLEARAWAIGQVTSAKAALELLAFRADEKHGRPWPEFAESSCYACHRGIQPDSDRKPRDQAPGLVPWNDWYFTMLRPIDGRSLLAGPGFDKLLTGLGQEMGRPLPDRALVARLAGEAAQALAKPLTTLDRAPAWNAASVQKQFDVLWKGRQQCAGDWDCAAQYYLALAAQYNALTDLDPKRRDAAVLKELKEMAARLRFPPGLASPGGTRPLALPGAPRQ